jgi:hypothetical protein
VGALEGGIPGLPIFAMLAVPWHVPGGAPDPEWADFFFIHERLSNRFLTTPASSRRAWYYFLLPLLVAGLLPGTTLLCAAGRTSAGGVPDATRFPDQPLSVDLVGVQSSSSSGISGSKLPTYILPDIPGDRALCWPRCWPRGKNPAMMRCLRHRPSPFSMVPTPSRVSILRAQPASPLTPLTNRNVIKTGPSAGSLGISGLMGVGSRARCGSPSQAAIRPGCWQAARCCF